MRKLVSIAVALAVAGALSLRAQQPAPQPQPDDVEVRPISPPPQPLPGEAATARITRFSFIAYGDTRSKGPSASGEPVEDGWILQREHSRVVDAMIKATRRLASTRFPVRFVVSSGDAVLYGLNGTMWNVSYVPLVERLTREAGLPFFFAVGNHDTTMRPPGDPEREHGLRNTLSAMSKLMPPDGSPRRLTGYPTYAFGYGNAFFVLLDSDIPRDETQFNWVASQLEALDRTRYRHVFAVFHHPPFDSGQHGGDILEPQSAAIRAAYLPLFRRHHVRMTICGHDHLLDHFVERYDDRGRTYRMDHIVSGGGGAPTYTYRGEPDLEPYLRANASQNTRIEHLVKPGPTVQDNPPHFLILRVDGERLFLEVVGAGPSTYTPYGRQLVDLN
jgi:calcineurin-like phosphoesterase family protein